MHTEHFSSPGPVMTKFTIALRELGTYKEVLRSQVVALLIIFSYICAVTGFQSNSYAFFSCGCLSNLLLWWSADEILTLLSFSPTLDVFIYEQHKPTCLWILDEVMDTILWSQPSLQPFHSRNTRPMFSYLAVICVNVYLLAGWAHAKWQIAEFCGHWFAWC